jgi:hypothetical protein
MMFHPGTSPDQQIHVIAYLALMQLDMYIYQSESLMKAARL